MKGVANKTIDHRLRLKDRKLQWVRVGQRCRTIVTGRKITGMVVYSTLDTGIEIYVVIIFYVLLVFGLVLFPGLG